MKKIVSLLLTVCLLCSFSVVVNAESHSTTVRYLGETGEDWMLEVPEDLEPGETGTVTLSGTWDKSTAVQVTTPNKVSLYSTKVSSEFVDVVINFGGITQEGTLRGEVSVSKDIKVGNVTEVVTGDWEGVLTYNVSSMSTDGRVKIPEGGTYYANVGLEYSDIYDAEFYYPGSYPGATIYEAGDYFPEEPQDGDAYVYGGIEYRYNYDYRYDLDAYEWTNSDGWGARVVDESRASYTMLEKICGKYLRSMRGTFYYKSGDFELVNSYGYTYDNIPAYVTNVESCFEDSDITGSFELSYICDFEAYDNCFAGISNTVTIIMSPYGDCRGYELKETNPDKVTIQYIEADFGM